MTSYKFRINGKEYNVQIGAAEGKTLKVNVNGADYQVEVENAPVRSVQAASPSPVQAPAASAAPTAPAATTASAAPAPAASGAETKVLSPMQGNVVEICAAPGDSVSAGQKIVVIESMKMEVEISAPAAGTVKAILVAKGDHLEENQSVATLA